MENAAITALVFAVLAALRPSGLVAERFFPLVAGGLGGLLGVGYALAAAGVALTLQAGMSASLSGLVAGFGATGIHQIGKQRQKQKAARAGTGERRYAAIAQAYLAGFHTPDVFPPPASAGVESGSAASEAANEGASASAEETSPVALPKVGE